MFMQLTYSSGFNTAFEHVTPTCVQSVSEVLVVSTPLAMTPSHSSHTVHLCSTLDDEQVDSEISLLLGRHRSALAGARSTEEQAKNIVLLKKIAILVPVISVRVNRAINDCLDEWTQSDDYASKIGRLGEYALPFNFFLLVDTSSILFAF